MWRLVMTHEGERLFVEGVSRDGSILCVDHAPEALVLDWSAAVQLAWRIGLGRELELEEVFCD